MNRDKSDRYEVRTAPSLAGHKRLGSYLVDAGLINRGQIEVALNDQKATGMKFGEILAARGWVKQQTVEYFMSKVVLPDRKSIEQKVIQPRTTTPPDLGRRGVRHTPSADSPVENGLRKSPPITKPLSATSQEEDGVSWVG